MTDCFATKSSPHLEIPLYKRLLSFLYPVCIERRSSPLHPVLDLYLHCDHWQLATDDAVYSDGKRYRPLITAFKQIRKELPGVQQVLVLGTGLASAVHILEHMDFHPSYTLVDIDKAVLTWAIELMPQHHLSRIEPICMDAQVFMQKNKRLYQLIVCDVFMGRSVPDFVSSSAFLEQCKTSLQPGGHFILNFLEINKSVYREIRRLMDHVFPGHTRTEFGINKI
ncbi:MAG: hypothetical protein EOO04_36710, partial [Chitinophagaceae bacterium]